MKFVKSICGTYINADYIVEISTSQTRDGRGTCYDIFVRTSEDQVYQIERYWFEADVKEALDKLLEELK